MHLASIDARVQLKLGLEFKRDLDLVKNQIRSDQIRSDHSLQGLRGHPSLELKFR